MGIRLQRKHFTLLFKIFLLMQLYSYLKLEVEAAQRRKNSTCNQPYHHSGNYSKKTFVEAPERPKRPARMIPANLLVRKEKDGTENDIIEDKRFYGPAYSCAQISELGYTLNGYYLVKIENQTRINQVEVLDCRFKHIDGYKRAKEERIGFINIEINTTKSVQRRSTDEFSERGLEEINHVLDRSKRPARLLPLRMILGKPKNYTENPRFYGPATSCSELERLGYTLNGLYLVDCKDKSNNGKIEVIECRFKQPQGSKEAKEERLGFVSLEAQKPKAVQRRSLNLSKKSIKAPSPSEIFKRPARLLPLQLLYGKERNDTEETIVIEKFYGPPTSCNELGKLGYTLNGYYLVNGTNIRNFEIALCRFHQSSIVVNETLKEERFGLVTTTTTKKPTSTSNQNNDGENEPLGLIDQIPFIENNGSTYKAIPLNHTAMDFYMLMNKHGRCLKTDIKLPRIVAQTICETKNLNLLWRKPKISEAPRVGKIPTIICNQRGFCISFNIAMPDIYLGKTKSGQDQNWDIVGDGNQLAKENNCLAIEGDSSDIGSKTVLAPCDPQQKGQIWSFVIEKLD